jgi:hypothetical protein
MLINGHTIEKEKRRGKQRPYESGTRKSRSAPFKSKGAARADGENYACLMR